MCLPSTRRFSFFYAAGVNSFHATIIDLLWGYEECERSRPIWSGNPRRDEVITDAPGL